MRIFTLKLSTMAKRKLKRFKNNGPGRKPIADKCVVIRIFPKSSRVAALGGESLLKEFCITQIENHFLQTKNQ